MFQNRDTIHISFSAKMKCWSIGQGLLLSVFTDCSSALLVILLDYILAFTIIL